LAVLVSVAAVHGAVLALRLPARLVMGDEVQFGRAAYALAGFALAQGLALPVWGALSDRFGRRRVIDYSLVATILASLLGFAPLLGLRLSPQFAFAVFHGLLVAGLPLAIAYCFSLTKEGPREVIIGRVVCGFFLGIAAMLVLRMWIFGLPRQQIGIATAVAVIVIAGAAALLASFLLPAARPTSVNYIGMNAMHGLWHGFTESNRVVFARWWKVFLASSALASGLILMLTWGASSEGGARSLAATGPALVFLASAAVFVLATASLLGGGRAKARVTAVASAIGLLVAAGLLLLKAQGSFYVAFGAAGLGGAAAATGMVVGVTSFAAVARQRSAGAEIGAVVAIWLAALLGGVLLAFATHPLDASAAPWIAGSAGAVSLFTAFMATRRAPGS
jgi:hypothetical protein